MAERQRKFVVDTNLFIDAFRDPDVGDQLEAFHSAFTPFEYLSAVVVQELRAGVTGAAALRLEQYVFGPFERRGRVVTPSYGAWKQAGEVLATLRVRAGLRPGATSRAFVNDVLIALSCRENGLTLVTANDADFARIAKVSPFVYVPPWPSPVT